MGASNDRRVACYIQRAEGEKYYGGIPTQGAGLYASPEEAADELERRLSPDPVQEQEIEQSIAQAEAAIEHLEKQLAAERAKLKLFQTQLRDLETRSVRPSLIHAIARWIQYPEEKHGYPERAAVEFFRDITGDDILDPEISVSWMKRPAPRLGWPD